MPSRMMTRFGRSVSLFGAAKLVIGSTIAGGVVSAAPAAAASCSPSSHCYAIDEWLYAPQNDGTYANMDVQCLAEPSPANNFVDEEIWEGTDNSPQANYWVETGMTEGTPWGSSRTFFWADNRPNYGYSQHQITGIAANINTWYSLEVHDLSNSTWGAYIDGTLYGYSTNNPTFSEAMEGGSEITNTGVRAAASFSSLAYVSGGTYFGSWSGTGYNNGPGLLSVPGPPQTSFSNYYDGTGTCTASAPAMSASPTPTMTSSPSPPPSAPSAGVRTALISLVRSIASANGDSNPTNITAVSTTRLAANQTAFGDTVTTDAGVYLVQAQGNFTGHLAAVPRGVPQPTGSTLTLIVDGGSLKVLDWGIQLSGLSSKSRRHLGSPTTLSS